MGDRHVVAGGNRQHRALGSVIFLIWADRTGRDGRPRRRPRRSCNRGSQYLKRRDRLEGVTRPRLLMPPPWPVQSTFGPQTARRPARGARHRAGRPSGDVEVTEANLEAEELVRSSQVPVVVLLWSPRSDASIQLGDALVGLAATDGSKWWLGDDERGHRYQGSRGMFRVPGRPDRRGA